MWVWVYVCLGPFKRCLVLVRPGLAVTVCFKALGKKVVPLKLSRPSLDWESPGHRR